MFVLAEKEHLVNQAKSEKCLVTKDGRLIWLVYSLLRDRSFALAGFVGVDGIFYPHVVKESGE
jgi:hypothetical protein